MFIYNPPGRSVGRGKIGQARRVDLWSWRKIAISGRAAKKRVGGSLHQALGWLRYLQPKQPVMARWAGDCTTTLLGGTKPIPVMVWLPKLFGLWQCILALTAMDSKFFSLLHYNGGELHLWTAVYIPPGSSGAPSGIEWDVLLHSLPSTLLDLSATSSASSCGLGLIVRGDSGRKAVFSATIFLYPKQKCSASWSEGGSKDKMGLRNFLCVILSHCTANRISFPKTSVATGQLKWEHRLECFPTNERCQGMWATASPGCFHRIDSAGWLPPLVRKTWCAVCGQRLSPPRPKQEGPI